MMRLMDKMTTSTVITGPSDFDAPDSFSSLDASDEPDKPDSPAEPDEPYSSDEPDEADPSSNIASICPSLQKSCLLYTSDAADE